MEKLSQICSVDHGSVKKIKQGGGLRGILERVLKWQILWPGKTRKGSLPQDREGRGLLFYERAS